jgi:hypothetical protein
MTPEVVELLRTVGAPSAIAIFLVVSVGRRLDRINESIGRLPAQFMTQLPCAALRRLAAREGGPDGMSADSRPPDR